MLIARIQAVPSILVVGVLIVLPIRVVVVGTPTLALVIAFSTGTSTLALVLDFSIGSLTIGLLAHGVGSPNFSHTPGFPLALQYWQDQPMLCLSLP